ncbi:MAG: L-rhamnose mutarotase [Mahellales bacterium]|jgi:L-rhamnose mutarotase
MIRVACNFRLKPGKQQEYKRRHDEIWPEMLEIMREAGISNYSIWNVGDQLFGYYEVDDYKKSNDILKSSEVVQKWNEYMADIIEFEIDKETGRMKEMQLMFLFE